METGKPLLLRAHGEILYRAHRVAGCCTVLYYNFARIGSGWRMALNCTPRQGQDISRTQSAACRRVDACSIPARVHSTSWALMCALPPPPLESCTLQYSVHTLYYCSDCRRIHTCSRLGISASGEWLCARPCHKAEERFSFRHVAVQLGQYYRVGPRSDGRKRVCSSCAVTVWREIIAETPIHVS